MILFEWLLQATVAWSLIVASVNISVFKYVASLQVSMNSTCTERIIVCKSEIKSRPKSPDTGWKSRHGFDIS